jgi:hypothetical protein
MGERITGGTFVEGQPTLGERVIDGAKRLTVLGEGIEFLEDVTGQVVRISVENIAGVAYEGIIEVPRTKLLELLKAEQDEVGAKLARVLDTLYGKR